MTKTNKENVKKVKEEKYRTEEQKEIIRFVKILILVIVFIVLIYFATRLFVKKDLVNNSEETSVTDISYSKMVFGTMLNRPYDEYYVFAYSSKDNKVNYYGAITDKYLSNKESVYVYYVDLEDSMNKDFLATDGKSNPKATSVSDLKVGDLTLIKVKNGKIVKYLENIKDIETEFKIK